MTPQQRSELIQRILSDMEISMDSLSLKDRVKVLDRLIDVLTERMNTADAELELGESSK